MKKIICISDTHSLHNLISSEYFNIKDKKNSILIHAGDVSNRGRIEEIDDFCKWYDGLDFPHKIFCAGNHDWGFQLYPIQIKKILKKYPTIIYLQDDYVVIDGIKIYGTPWQPEFYNWAFNLKRGKELQEKWKYIDNDINILVSHSPPFGILDYVERDMIHVGCEDLKNRISELKSLKINIFGHIHQGYGQIEEAGVKFVNASICTERYIPTNKPIIIEYDN
jgi:Icc-related predicted phosphoesterase